VREALGEHAALVPASARGLAGGLVELPESLEEAVLDGPIRVALLEGAGGLEIVLAVRAAPRLPHLERGGPAPGILWVEGEAAAHRRAPDGTGRLVLGRDRRSVERAAAYLLTTAEDRAAPELSLEVVDDRGATRLRQALDDWLDARERDGRLAIAAERRRHAEAPPFGEPEAALEIVTDLGHRLAALLPDVAHASATLRSSPAGPELSVRLAVRAGSPSEALVAGLGEAELATLVSALPAGTTLALASASDRAGRQEHSAWIADALTRLGGDRRGPSEADALSRALSAWDEARFDAAVHALAEVEGHPALVFASAGEGAVGTGPVPLPFAAAPYLTTVLGALVGCPLVAPAELTLDARAAESAAAEAALCPSAYVGVERRPAAVVAAIGAPGLAAGVAAAIGGTSSDPDRARLLMRHAGPRLLLLLLAPERAPLLARALTGAPTPMPDRSSALILSIARAHGGIELTLGGDRGAWTTLSGGAVGP
jgi:hypothetical protein